MPRTKEISWHYACDALNHHHDGLQGAYLSVDKGDPCDTRRGTVVNDQADADEVARQAGWQLAHGGRQTFCPRCTGRGGAA